jgi:hypothetical protein
MSTNTFLKGQAMTPVTTQELSRRAVLVRLKVSLWTASHRDQEMGSEVADAKRADRDAVNCIIKYLPEGAMRGVTSARWQLKRAHEQYTLPWLDGGTRILPAALYDKYNEKVSKYEANYQEAVSKFVSEYPTWYANATERLGDIDMSRMPHPSDISARFGVSRQTMPMPSITDWRVDLGADQLKVAQESAERSIQAAAKESVQILYTKLEKCLDRIVKTLEIADQKFKNTLIDNLKDLCEMIPILDITDDPELDKLRRACVSRLTKLNPDSLREEPETREQTVKAAKRILNKVRKIDLDLE